MMQVKNRAPAKVQVTAEQLVRAAREFQADDGKKLEQLKASTRITDEEELKMHQAEERREFERKLRRSLVRPSAYMRYAKWEEGQLEFRRARSIYERALGAEPDDPAVYVKYAEFEMRNKFVNHARNVLDRAVQHLPRQSQLWYKYAHFEEALGQIDKARLVFERWMAWHPEEQAWSSYVNFEMRHGEAARARDVYERFCGSQPRARSYIKYARWEEGNGQMALARAVFERALEELDRTEATREALFVEFAQFETRCGELERARAIYKQALDLLPKERSRELYEAFVAFERQHGDRGSIESVLVAKRRTQYEHQVAAAPTNYDLWFDYTRLEEAQAQAEASAARSYVAAVTEGEGEASGGAALFKDKAYAAKVVDEARQRVRAVYERAIKCLPPSDRDKALWRRYIYLWINYALFEETQVGDVEATRAVYKRCLDLVPHKRFTFAKLWVMAAHFELRQRNLRGARLLLGEAIGRAPRDKVFRAYIQLELQLGDVDNCRRLYDKYLEFAPHNCFVWRKYAELEVAVGETARARAIFELAVNQPVLDMPEALWKRYIDFEIGLKSRAGRAKARSLYERLLERTNHVKVWISFAKFEALVAGEPEQARTVFRKAYERIKAAQAGDDDLAAKEDRALLLKSWLQVEEDLLRAGKGSEVEADKVRGLQPRKVKKKREIDGGGWEEYFDFMFPDDPKKGLKLLQLAQKWKRDNAAAESPSAKRARTDGVPAAPAPGSAPAAADQNEIDLDDI